MVGKARVMVGAVAIVAMGLTAACSGSSSSGNGSSSSSSKSSYNAAVTGIVNPSTKTGGTLNLWSSQDADSWDPGVSYYAWTIDMQRLFSRTLLAYAPKPGKDGLQLEPDLAEAMPTISADKLTYTYKLRSGLKWDDGTALTSKDVKYGIERTFAQDVIPGGPIYAQQDLDEGQNYPGPYKDTSADKLGLKSVQTPDDQTIIFKLAKPDADFVYEMSMPIGAPVPQKRDTGAKYNLAPASSGPYMFAKGGVQVGKSYTWVRNPYWSKAVDPIRSALPDKITLTITTNANDLDSRLIAGTADLDVSQSGVQAEARTQILQDPKLKANADDPNTGFIRYAAMSQNVAPFDNIDCRKAVIYASDPTSIQAARGGPYGGDIGTSMLPPNIAGSDPNYDPYNRKQGQPQVSLAKQELAKCGKPNGFDTKIAVRNNKPAEIATATALQAALKVVGINATIAQYDGSQIASVVGSPNNVKAKGYGIEIAGWGADYPTGGGFLSALANGSFILQNGNYNLPLINDPAINALFKQASVISDPTQAAAIYTQINQKIMEGAYYLPFVFDKALNYRNPRLTNVYEQQGLAMIDFQALGVDDGK